MKRTASSWGKWSVLYIPLMVSLILCVGCSFIVRGIIRNSPIGERFLDTFPADLSTNGTATLSCAGEGTNKILRIDMYASNPYSFGFLAGKTLGPEIEKNVVDALKAAEKLIPKPVAKRLTWRGKRAFARGALQEAWAEMERHVPREDMEEMKGLYDGLRYGGVTNVTLDMIYWVHALADLGETSCSAAYATGKATRDGGTYQLRILDFGMANFAQLVSVYHNTRPGEHSFVNVGYIGFIGSISGMNDRGVALSEMGPGKFPKDETLDGIPMVFLMKRILRSADTAEAAVALVHAAQRNNHYNYVFGDALHGYGLRTSSKECTVFPLNGQTEIADGKGGILPQYEDVLYAGHYGTKQGLFVKDKLGELDTPVFMEMSKVIAMKSNIQVVIYKNSTLEMWVAVGAETVNKEKIRAADRPYAYIDPATWATQSPKKK